MKSKQNKGKAPRLGLVAAITVVTIFVCILGILIVSGGDLFNRGQDQLSAEEKANQISRNAAAEQGLLILVNKQHPVEEAYKPDDLVAMSHFAPDRSAAGRYMRAEAASAFDDLVEQASLDGVEIKMTTAYRSFGFQKMLYDSYVAQYGEEEAGKFSAIPGQSEHQTGLAVDVSSPSVDYQLTEAFGETDEGKWIAAHAHEFGFILRYPEGKEDITGYMYEPWHLRYVGKFVSDEIHEENTTLEEYLEKYL